MMILFTGGGTGGHLYPLIAVMRELKKIGGDSVEVRYMGAKHDLNRELATLGIPVQTIASSKLRRYFSLLNFLDFFKFFLGFFQALVKLYIIMPDLVFSKGGPGALSVVLASWFYRTPLYIHESDAVPGITNKISGRFAKHIFLSFESAGGYFPKGKTSLVGNPIREEMLGFVGKESRKEAKINPPTFPRDIEPHKEDLKPPLITVARPQHIQEDGGVKLGFRSQDKLILVLGGSQGATRINNFIWENLREFVKIGSVFHQVGPANTSDAEAVVDDCKTTAPKILDKYKWAGFLGAEELSRVLTATDIVIARAGAGSIFEIAAFGKPSILIPLGSAAGDHQTKNAYEYEKTGACVVIEEPNLTPGVVIQKVGDLLSDRQKLSDMAQAAKSFAKPDAARRIAEKILEYVGFLNR